MFRSELRSLFGYDRWATRRVLNTAEDVTATVWTRPEPSAPDGIAGLLVHALGAHGRWRAAWEGREDEPRPERELPMSAVDVRARWEAEWVALDALLERLGENGPNRVWNGLPLWQAMLHVVNHGTQHRSEAAALLTAAGHPTGDLDFYDFLGESAD